DGSPAHAVCAVQLSGTICVEWKLSINAPEVVVMSALNVMNHASVPETSVALRSVLPPHCAAITFAVTPSCEQRVSRSHVPTTSPPQGETCRQSPPPPLLPPPPPPHPIAG